jgi:hypothetical protein
LCTFSAFFHQFGFLKVRRVAEEETTPSDSHLHAETDPLIPNPIDALAKKTCGSTLRAAFPV